VDLAAGDAEAAELETRLLCPETAPAFDGAVLPDGRKRLPYDQVLPFEGAPGDVAFSLAGDELPPGLTLDVDGRLHGEPTAAGDFAFDVLASSPCFSATATFELHVPEVILMSGYGPFWDYPTNPSIESLRPLDQQLVAAYDIRVVELPVVWGVAWETLRAEIDRLEPRAVIASGMADSLAMRYETTAVNAQWGWDEAGVNMKGVPIVADGPLTMESTFPVEEVSAAVEAEGYAVMISKDAGAYLCNYAFYMLTWWEELEASWPVVTGFVHVPPVPYKEGFTLEEITAAHVAGLKALAEWIEAGEPVTPPQPDTFIPPDYASAW
jgi:pyroglutamyl-peptidase